MVSRLVKATINGTTRVVDLISTPAAPAQLVWSDEFTGSSLSLATDSGGGGTWRTKGYEAGGALATGYTDFAGSSWNVSPTQHPSGFPVTVADSVLTITAKRNPGLSGVSNAWIGAYLVTNHLTGLVWRYGYFEWRARVPVTGRGMFPALWLFNNIAGRSDGKEGAEIDMFEIFGEPDGLPWAAGYHNRPVPGVGFNAGNFSTDVTGWHRYGIEWTPTYLRYFRDGVQISEVAGSTAEWFQTANLGVRINYAMDPNWLASGDPNKSTSSDPAPGTELRLEVDYVRVFDKKPANLAVGSDDPEHPVSFVTMATDYEATIPSGTSGYTTPTLEQATAVADAWDLLVAGNLSGAQTLLTPYRFVVDEITDATTGRVFRRMYEVPRSDGSWQQAWGMYVYSPSAPNNLVVECAHPLADIRTVELSADLFIRSNARAFFMAGAHRDAGGSTADKDTDPADVANFNGVLVFREVHRRTLTWTNSYTVQPHGFTDAEVSEYAVISASSIGPNRWARKVMDGYQDIATANGFAIRAYADGMDTRLSATGNEEAKLSYQFGRPFLHVEHNPTLRSMDAAWKAGNQVIADSLPFTQPGSTLPTFVRQATATSGTGTTLSLVVPITANTSGNCLVTTIAMRTDTGREVGSITDTAGNVWLRATESHPGTGSSTRTETWFTTNAAATTSITINLIGGAAIKVAANVSEWAGVETSGAYDNDAITSGVTVTAAASGQVVPIDTNTVLIAAINSSTLGTARTFASAGGGWTELTRYETSGGSDVFGATAWKTLAVPTSSQAQWNHSASINYSGSTVALRGRAT